MFYTFDFSAEIATPATLASVSYSTDSGGLTLEQQSDDLSNKRSSIRIKGAVHGRVYTVKAIGVTSAGEIIPKNISIRGLNA